MGLGFIAGSVLASYVTLTCGTGTAQSAEVASAIHQAAAEYGVSEGWLRRAYCESRFVPWATSRGGHMGLYQYAHRTWLAFSRWAGWEGAAPTTPGRRSMVTAWAFRNGYASHWACR